MKLSKVGWLFVGAIAFATAACDRETSTVAYDAPERPSGAVTQNISGTVSQVDNTAGLLTLRTDAATMRLPFNPATMGEMSDGQHISARLTLAKAPAERDGRAFDAPMPRYVPDGAIPSGEDQVGQRSVTGTVKDIDHKAGTFTLQAENGPLNVYFPPAGIRDLKDGDRITLYAVFTRDQA
jgi:Cu/Ag efflux protein CusF